MLELAFRPDPDRAAPIYRQLEQWLRELIDAGRLVPGERLPPSRELAEQLGLSRNTVNHAYGALVEDGVLAARVGRGTFVAARSGLRPARPDAREPARGFAWEGLLSAAARRGWPPRLATTERPGVPIRFDFRGGRVDPATLPVAEWRRAWARAVGEGLPAIANPESPAGHRPLREEIALALVARGIRCEPGDVLVTSGAQQALDLVARVLLDPGDVVVVEDPGYFGARLAFERCGAQLVGVSVDERGLRTDELSRILRSRRAKLVYTTPSAQFPTGATLSEARREALLDLADAHHVPVFEDDYDSELRFEGPPIPALKTRDPAGRVIYAGTFSKALFPGLRLAYLVAAPPLRARLVAARAISDFGSDAVAQAVVADLMASGALERHVRRVRRTLGERRRALLEALAEHLPSDARWTRPAGGHTVWVELPGDVDPDVLAVASGAAGIAYARGDGYTLDASGHRFAALAFAQQSPEALRQGVAEWAALMETSRRRAVG